MLRATSLTVIPSSPIRASVATIASESVPSAVVRRNRSGLSAASTAAISASPASHSARATAIVPEFPARAGMNRSRHSGRKASPLGSGGRRVPRSRGEPPDHPWFHDGGPPIVLAAGRLVGQRDFATLIDTFRRMRAEFPCRPLIPEKGPMRDDLERYVSNVALDAATSLPGWVETPFPTWPGRRCSSSRSDMKASVISWSKRSPAAVPTSSSLSDFAVSLVGIVG